MQRTSLWNYSPTRHIKTTLENIVARMITGGKGSMPSLNKIVAIRKRDAPHCLKPGSDERKEWIQRDDQRTQHINGRPK
jgi:hypothetical protein